MPVIGTVAGAGGRCVRQADGDVRRLQAGEVRVA